MANETVDVIVKEIRPNGVLATIVETGRVGLIRRRDFSWDRRLNSPRPVFEVGQQLKARLQSDHAGDRYAWLSIRLLTDPWEDITEKYSRGQVVSGEVVNVRSRWVFVQIEPGVDARVDPKDIPLMKDQYPEDVLSVGDRVQGVITGIDASKRLLGLSLLERLRDLSSLSLEERESVQLALFSEKLWSWGGMSAEQERNIRVAVPSLRYRLPIPRPKKILVIDENKYDLHRISQRIREEYDVEVIGVETGSEATTLVEADQLFDMAIVSLLVNEENGTRVADDLLQIKPDLAVIISGTSVLAEDKALSGAARQLPFAPKESENVDEIVDWIDRLCSGYWEEAAEGSDTTYTGKGSFVEQLGMLAWERNSPPHQMQKMLERLRLETQATRALLLEIDEANRKVSILAADPRLEESLSRQSLDGLYYSPVRTVVEDEEPFYAANVRQASDKRFRYFFPLLSFRACLGLPITIPDLKTKHALFLLREDKPRFNPQELDAARLAAKLLQISLERRLLFDFMRRYEQRYTLGQLIGSLVHEVANKLDGMEGHVGSLPVLLDRIGQTEGLPEHSGWLTEAKETAFDIAELKQELMELVESYSRMVAGDLEDTDVNEVIRKVKLQLETEANDAGIHLVLNLEEGLPSACAIPSRLEQILTNLLLNSIQQIDHQARLMYRVARQRRYEPALLQQGVIVIQTQWRTHNGTNTIQINIVDTGPGIHRQQQQDMFRLDTSTRPEGHGLGLFISRNLAETMGGRLDLVDSLMFVGSAFAVQLPVWSTSEVQP